MKRIALISIITISLLFLVIHTSEAIRIGRGSPEFRAIGGVSMGGYGAMNIGLGHPDLFKTIAGLGGPLDMEYLLKFIEVDMLGNYDNPDAYPNRDTLMDMIKDLSISFGNPVYYNPDSTYYAPGITSENARKPTALFHFIDELNPDGSLPAITYVDPDPFDWVEVLLTLDRNQNNRRDRGEPILTRFHEPFSDANRNGIYDAGEPFTDSNGNGIYDFGELYTDLNQNGIYDAGEAFQDVGLDGVPGTKDYGEGDGLFTFNPRRLNYLAQDPFTRAALMAPAVLQGLNLYIDAGTTDEFQFNVHAENFVHMTADRDPGLAFTVENGFPEDFPRISHFRVPRVYVRYEGGHVGFDKENLGVSFARAKQGIREAITVANRFTTLFAFVSDHWPGGEYGTDPYELWRYPSKMGVTYFRSPSLGRNMRFGIYLPPGYSRSRTTYYPVLYLLGGYNMSIAGLANSYVKSALDLMILSGEIQKMIIVIPEGTNYKNKRGHFFVNQIDPERGDRFMDYFFDLVTFIDDRLQTK
jgi:hypothetical protein